LQPLMGSLTEILLPYFSSTIRTHGEQYFIDRKVRTISATPDFYSAKVRGSLDYFVEMRASSNTLLLSCKCPYFDDNSSCKHLWAAALMAESCHCFPALKENARVQFKSREDDGDGLSSEPSGNNLKRDPLLYQLPFQRSVPRYGYTPARAAHPELDWKQLFSNLSDGRFQSQTRESRIQKSDIIYCLNPSHAISSSEIALQLGLSQIKSNGERSKFQPIVLKPDEFNDIAHPLDRQIMLTLYGAGAFVAWNQLAFRVNSNCFVPIAAMDVVLPLLAASNRFFIQDEDSDIVGPLHFDAEEEWEFRLSVAEVPKKKDLVMSGAFWKGDVSRTMMEPMLIAGRYVFWRGGTMCRLKDHGGFQLLSSMRRSPEIFIPARQSEDFVSTLLTSAADIPIALPESLRYEEVSVAPVPLLRISGTKEMRKDLTGILYFLYDGHELQYLSAKNHVDRATRRIFHRDVEFESAAMQQLEVLGFKKAQYWNSFYSPDQNPMTFSAKKLPHVVGRLLTEGWKIEAEGVLYRKPGNFSLSVNSSGIDWFDLHAQCDFDGLMADLPAILEALKKGEQFIALGNGVIGLLPNVWLEKYSRLAAMGEVHEGRVRFKKSQALIIDMLLQEQPEARCDELFSRLRDELRNFSGISPAQAPASFTGALRPYQKEGLGWFEFLQRFGFGGCLADDMGLGKTIQALALLALRAEQRRAASKKGGPTIGPSLGVVPRSLIFNWMREAERFTPTLRVLDFSHIERRADIHALNDFDLVLITYGTLRRDIEILREIVFDYIILDEAQAIKNAVSLTAKATRLLKATHRIAMSGTPIENHLGELWSIFEFLNPGMLGSSPAFREAASGMPGPEDNSIAMLARALRPFILRRTKTQVASDLPQKTEETLVCEMDLAQRGIYNDLRDHYRANLLAHVKSVGIAKARIQVLEALLRLRQAACHPALIDKKRAAEPSAKLDTLLAQLDEVLDGGYKALVFSQFTSMLALVRDRLDKRKVVYEYLDGRTRDRQARVDRFQNDPGCPLFLISLKAGGLGLNLTAAEYVFLLDPWWNPAVEAQAIDRTHRIGQTKPVFAYRLICKDTVEEKVLELQKSKRALADSIIGADNGVLRSMRVEDLELLLG
jgi:hypothetical protein